MQCHSNKCQTNSVNESNSVISWFFLLFAIFAFLFAIFALLLPVFALLLILHLFFVFAKVEIIAVRFFDAIVKGTQSADSPLHLYSSGFTPYQRTGNEITFDNRASGRIYAEVDLRVGRASRDRRTRKSIASENRASSGNLLGDQLSHHTRRAH